MFRSLSRRCQHTAVVPVCQDDAVSVSGKTHAHGIAPRVGCGGRRSVFQKKRHVGTIAFPPWRHPVADDKVEPEFLVHPGDGHEKQSAVHVVRTDRFDEFDRLVDRFGGPQTKRTGTGMGEWAEFSRSGSPVMSLFFDDPAKTPGRPAACRETSGSVCLAGHRTGGISFRAARERNGDFGVWNRGAVFVYDRKNDIGLGAERFQRPVQHPFFRIVSRRPRMNGNGNSGFGFEDDDIAIVVGRKTACAFSVLGNAPCAILWTAGMQRTKTIARKPRQRKNRDFRFIAA